MLKQNYLNQLYSLAKLKKQQWLKEEELNKIQEKKLIVLINHAYHNVPFYRNLFESVRIKPKDITSLANLQKVPILTKDNIRKNYPEKIIANDVDIKNCVIKSTTGSTGMPLKVAYSKEMLDYVRCVSFFVFLEFGLRLTDRFVRICDIGNENVPFPSFLKKLGILNWEYLSIFDPVESIIRSLKKLKPAVIFTFPSVLLLISKEIEEQNIIDINPRLVFTSGEVLSNSDRKKISTIFNSDVYSMYGTEENGLLAFECEKQTGYHVISDTAIIEMVKNGRNVEEGERGDIVVTSLFNYSMPLIRYNIGDIGTFTNKKCACGRGLPLIKSIEGRKDDFLILPSGKKVSPRVINVIEYIPGVAMYRTVQETKNRIVVNLIKGNGYSQKTIYEIKRHIKAGCLGEAVEVEVNLVDELPREGRGKLRAVISKVKEE
jgi:phenylacetate-CoA ligase